MELVSPIFADAETPVDDLIAAYGAQGWIANREDVGSVQAAQAIDGENWAPQLTKYEEWEWHTDAADEQVEESHDLWRLRTGVPEELRERIAKGQEKAKQERLARQRAEEAARAQSAVSLAQVFGVKDGGDGLVLAKVNLREFASHGNPDRDLVVVLPSSAGGEPVTRIGADAFSRFNVRGIGVRLLVVPDSVTSIDAKAFANLSARVIYLGAGCRHLGEQPLERWDMKPAVERRDYVISPDNRWWVSNEGSVYSKDGAELFFLAPPYGKRVAIPEGVRRVGASAFAKWDAVPEVVECGRDLGRVGSKLWDGALWLCDADARMAEALAKRNVRTASRRVVTVDNCWYDFDEGGAVLVAGPPAPPTASQTFARAAVGFGKPASDAESGALSPSDMARQSAHATQTASVLSVPHVVEAAPVTRIAPRALVTAPETVILPEGLASVGHDNACKGTRRLSLPQSLRRIEAHCFCSRELEGVTSVPAGVLSIGEGCFEYGIVRLEHTGTIVHISANQLLNCFVERTDDEMAALEGAGPAERVPFDFERYDRMLCEGRSLPDRLGALVHRIASPAGLAEKTRGNLVAQLRAEADAVMEYVAREGDSETVARLVDAGFIDDATFDRQIELLRRANRTDCVMLLMERRHGSAPQQASVKSRFSL